MFMATIPGGSWARGAGAVIATTAVIVGGIVGSRVIEDTPSEFWSGTFDCYGTLSDCTGTLPTPASCTTTVSAASLDATAEAASGGAVICVNSGTGSIDMINEEYASTVTVQPASGASVTLSTLRLENVDNLTVSGNGGGGASMTIDGSVVDPSDGLSDCSLNITVEYVVYSEQAAFVQESTCSHDQNLLWTNNKHPGNDSGVEYGRMLIKANSANNPAANFGLVIRDSLFCCSTGPSQCHDGISFQGDPYGATIGPGNEFTGMDQTSCGPHVDAIEGLGDRHTTVIGNWFHDNSFSGGTLQNCCSSDLLIVNNAFANVEYHDATSMGGPNGMTLIHNVFYNNSGQGTGDYDVPCGNGATLTYRDNVYIDGNITRNECLSTMTFAISYNLNCAFCINDPDWGDPSNIAGTPVFEGDGSTCSGTGCPESQSYYAWVLDSSSPGYNAGSDSTSMGIGPEHADGT